MTEFGFLTFTFSGINGAGGISVPGLKVGDRVIWTTQTKMGSTLYESPGAFVGFSCTTADQIDQVDTSNNTGATIEILVYRGG